MVDLRRTLTLADRWRRRPIARRGRGGGALGSRASPGPLGGPFRRARESVGLARRRPGEAPKRRTLFVLTKRSTSFGTAIFPPGVRRPSSGRAGGGFSSALNACTRRGTAKNFARRLATPPCGMIVPAASCSAKSMVTRQEKKGASLLSPSYSPQSPQTQSTPEEQLQHKRPVCGRDRLRDRAAASSRDVAATAAARDRTGKRNEATAGPDAGLRAAEPPAREAGLLQRGWTFIIEAFIEPPQTYAGVL